MNEMLMRSQLLAAVLLAAPVVVAQTEPATDGTPSASPAVSPSTSGGPAAAPATTAGPAAATPVEGRRAITQSEALRSALQNNPALRGAEIDVKSRKAQVSSQQGRYPYYLNADAGFTHRTSTQLSADDSIRSNSSESVDTGVGLRRLFAAGTLAEVRAEGEYFHLNGQSAAFGVTPFAASGYGATFRASVTQPLLRGYGSRVGEAELRAARVSQRVAEKNVQRMKSSLIGDVVSAYLELWYSSRAVDIETTSLELARQQREQARARLSLGAISKVDLLSFQTRASELEEGLISAELSRQQRSLALSFLMGQTPLSTDLMAATEPDLPEQQLDRLAVEAAMRADSVELAELEQQVELARVRSETAGESWRPKLDLQGWVLSSGASTTFPNAWARAARGSYWSLYGGAVLDLPLDDSARTAEQMQAQLAVESALLGLESARRRVASDASTAIANERAARERLASAERTSSVAEETYQAERTRYDLGQTLVLSVQEAEAALRRARLREARAQVDVAQARLILLHLTGELLKTAGQ